MTEFEIAAEIARCHRYGWNATSYRCDAPQSAQSAVSWMQTRDVPGSQPAVPNRIAELEHQLAAMTRERDIALLRMEVAIATSHAWIDAEVRRRSQLLGIPEHVAPAFPASALRHQHQSIGLLSTADAGRVRLGGYAPSLPPR